MLKLFEMWQDWMRRRGSWKMVARRLPDGTDEPYLERFYLFRVCGQAVFLHRFWASDQDGYHDHPWHAASLILRGGYFEESADGQLRWRGPLSWRALHGEMFHRVSVPDDLRGRTWTIFWHGHRWRDWGFLDEITGRWEAAMKSGNQDTREMRGWILPRFVEVEA